MKLKNKVIATVVTYLVVLLILPFAFVSLAQPHEAMGVFMLFFFIINPIACAVTSAFIGKDIKKLWWFPILFAITFLLSFWLVLKEIVLDLTIYAIIYILIGFFVMFVSWLVRRK